MPHHQRNALGLNCLYVSPYVNAVTRHIAFEPLLEFTIIQDHVKSTLILLPTVRFVNFFKVTSCLKRVDLLLLQATGGNVQYSTGGAALAPGLDL